jgi:rhodanese-related sulfurtransferase
MALKKFSVLILIMTLIFSGCTHTGKKAPENVKAPVTPEIQVNREAMLLLKYLEQTGDYVNSRNFPSLIKASIVYKELGTNNLVIDLRKPDLFRKGHIKGAVNISQEGLPEYLETKIKPFTFGKIILVCSTGQVSSYAASLLRLMGYGNVYAMRWGMSAWNKESAKDFWLKGISSAYENRLDSAPVTEHGQNIRGRNSGRPFPEGNG